MCVCVCACVCSRWEGSWVFASAAPVVVWTDMYLTSYSDIWLVSTKHVRHLIDVTPVWKKSSMITANYIICVHVIAENLWATTSSKCLGNHIIFLLRLFWEGESLLWLFEFETIGVWNWKRSISIMIFCFGLGWVGQGLEEKGIPDSSDCSMPLQPLIWISKLQGTVALDTITVKVFLNYLKTLINFCTISLF